MRGKVDHAFCENSATPHIQPINSTSATSPEQLTHAATSAPHERHIDASCAASPVR